MQNASAKRKKSKKKGGNGEEGRAHRFATLTKEGKYEIDK
jgi:hypothetical protein